MNFYIGVTHSKAVVIKYSNIFIGSICMFLAYRLRDKCLWF